MFGAIDDPVRSPFEVASLGTADADASSRAAASLASSSAGRVGSEKRVSEKLVSPLGGATASEAFGGESPHAPLFSARSKTLLMVCARAARAAALSSGFCAETEIISCAATAARSDSPRSAKDSLVAAARRTATTPGASRGSSPELDAHRHTHAKIAACWACRSRVEGGAATAVRAAAARRRRRRRSRRGGERLEGVLGRARLRAPALEFLLGRVRVPRGRASASAPPAMSLRSACSAGSAVLALPWRTASAHARAARSASAAGERAPSSSLDAARYARHASFRGLTLLNVHGASRRTRSIALATCAPGEGAAPPGPDEEAGRDGDGSERASAGSPFALGGDIIATSEDDMRRAASPATPARCARDPADAAGGAVREGPRRWFRAVPRAPNDVASPRAKRTNEAWRVPSRPSNKIARARGATVWIRNRVRRFERTNARPRATPARGETRAGRKEEPLMNCLHML